MWVGQTFLSVLLVPSQLSEDPERAEGRRRELGPMPRGEVVDSAVQCVAGELLCVGLGHESLDTSQEYPEPSKELRPR